MKNTNFNKFDSLLRSYRNQTECMNHGEEKRGAVVGNDSSDCCSCGCLSAAGCCDCLNCISAV